ncbi:MAG: hypothetical protein WD342_14675 [Verrucomicrobiales bacterium]
MQDDFSKAARAGAKGRPRGVASNFNDSLSLVHGPAARAFREIEIGRILENMIADTANYEMLATTVLAPFSENFGGNPGGKQGA